jgi:outer membrane protein assembly factor BamB
MSSSETKVTDLIFVAANSLVKAFDRYDGREIWTWTAIPAGAGFFQKLSVSKFVTVSLDRDRLVVAGVKGVWCLDPLTGEEVWHAPVDNFKGGYPIIAGGTPGPTAAVAAQVADAAAQASTGAM